MYVHHLQSQLIAGISHWQVIATRPDKLILKVLDKQGRLAKTCVQAIQNGTQQLMIDLSDLAAGDYVINAFCSDHFVKCFRVKCTQG